ncbi:helix-turn-helix domain-containing protein [Rummeliibacillus sp. NPDC094406]|uniref:helix-turn-helix domain-containing protein n=1 Tax=Rummeliibacillus sp. NPDC094406 TaxID=3364511 RepID=UPI003828E587
MKNVRDLMKDLRGNQTQQKTAGEMHVARETISRYETGKDKVNVDVANKYSKKYDDPCFAMTVQNEYTGTGPVWLDGPNADLHRSAIKEKTLEELEEAFSRLKETGLSKPLSNLQPFELQEVHEALEELVEAETAISQFIAVVCMETGISYRGLWMDHYRYLISQGFLKED